MASLPSAEGELLEEDCFCRERVLDKKIAKQESIRMNAEYSSQLQGTLSERDVIGLDVALEEEYFHSNHDRGVVVVY